jgi:nucleoside-diphosphate-sugar epimerase
VEVFLKAPADLGAMTAARDEDAGASGTRVLDVCVTGASGFVGRELCSALQRSGHRVRAAVRDPRHSVSGCTEVVGVGDIAADPDWNAALHGVDVVVHTAARVHVMRDTASDPLAAFRRVNVAATERLARAAVENGVRRLVFLSSIKVNGDATTGRAFSAAEPAAPRDAYGISKHEAEQVLQRIARESGLELVIVRPPLVYGPGVGGNFLRLLRLVERGIPLPLGAVHNRRSMIYNGNLADALIACAAHPAAADKTYLVSDGDDRSTSSLIGELASGMGKRARLLRVPPSALDWAGRLTGKREEVERLTGSLVVDSSPIRRELDWHAPFSVHDGLERTTEWFLADTHAADP